MSRRTDNSANSISTNKSYFRPLNGHTNKDIHNYFEFVVCLQTIRQVYFKGNLYDW